MIGTFLSTLSPVYGPAVVQLPATSHTVRLGVVAEPVSVPVGMLVVRVRDASPGLARPDPASPAVHAMEISAALQPVGGVTHDTVGGVVSTMGFVNAVRVEPAGTTRWPSPAPNPLCMLALSSSGASIP